MADADSQTTDPSVRGVRISDLMTGGIFPATSLYAASECANGCALTRDVDAYAFLLIFWTSWAPRRFPDPMIRADRTQSLNRAPFFSVTLSRQGATFGRDCPAFLLLFVKIIPESYSSKISDPAFGLGPESELIASLKEHIQKATYAPNLSRHSDSFRTDLESHNATDPDDNTHDSN
jgi:hypothetical protein